MNLLLLLASLAMVAVEPSVPASTPRRDDVASIKMSVDEDDLSMSFETQVRFEAGKKAGGAVGGVAVGNRQLQMTFTPVEGQKSLYQVDARWCITEGAKRKAVFVGQAVAGYGQPATISQLGPAGTFKLEVTIEPGQLVLGSGK